tara:strand:+ start:844 stop:1323 length:480 start_codon:yes stop_codon:yes gene_type:complete
MENKKRFYIYNSWKDAIELLSTEEQGTMLMNLFKYSEGMEPTLNTSGLKLVWASMRYLLERDSAKYEEAVQRGKNAASKRQAAVPQSKAAAPQIDLLHGIDNDNVNVNDNGNENGGDTRVETVGTFDTFITPDIPNPLTGVTESQRKAAKGEEFDNMFK